MGAGVGIGVLSGLLIPVLTAVRRCIGETDLVALLALAGAALGVVGYRMRVQFFLALCAAPSDGAGRLPPGTGPAENRNGRCGATPAAENKRAAPMRRPADSAWPGGWLCLPGRQAREGTRALFQLAYSDPLTGLPNRRWFFNCATAAIARAAKSDSSLALIFMDLDYLKETNDSLGHSAGDRLLQSVALRLGPVLDPRDFLGRIGGDEFCLLIRRPLPAGEMLAYADMLRSRLSAPVTVGKNRLNVSASFGISRYPQDGMTCAELLRHADAAMYAAKRSGKNRVRLFDAGADFPAD